MDVITFSFSMLAIDAFTLAKIGVMRINNKSDQANSLALAEWPCSSIKLLQIRPAFGERVISPERDRYRRSILLQLSHNIEIHINRIPACPKVVFRLVL